VLFELPAFPLAPDLLSAPVGIKVRDSDNLRLSDNKMSRRL